MTVFFRLLLSAIVLSQVPLEAGVKSLGMGGVGVAYAQDATNGFQNPAGMVEVGDRFDIGVGIFHQKGTVDVQGNALPQANGRYDATRGCPWFPAFDFGINKMLTPNISAGLVLGPKTLLIKTDYKKPFLLFGSTNCGEEHLLMFISPMLSFKIGDRHSFGIALDIGVQRLKASGFQNYEGISAFPGHVTNNGYDYDDGYGFSLGWKSHITDWLALGIRFDSEMWVPSRWNKYKGFIAVKGKVNNPAVLAFGATAKYKKATFSLDIERVYAAKIPSYHNQVYPNVFEAKTALADGPGHGYGNLTVYHVGVDYQLCSSTTIRAGWIYGKTGLTPHNTLSAPTTLGCVESTLTIGGTYKYNACTELSFLYNHGFPHKVRGKDSIAPQFGGGEVDIKYQTDLFMLGFGRYF